MLVVSKKTRSGPSIRSFVQRGAKGGAPNCWSAGNGSPSHADEHASEENDAQGGPESVTDDAPRHHQAVFAARPAGQRGGWSRSRELISTRLPAAGPRILSRALAQAAPHLSTVSLLPGTGIQTHIDKTTPNGSPRSPWTVDPVDRCRERSGCMQLRLCYTSD